MAMGDCFNHEANGAELVSGGGSGQPCFPVIGGKVTIQIEDVEEIIILPVIEGLRIQNAFESDGEIVHELCGQPYKFIVTNIYKQVFTDEMKKARMATIFFAKQIADAVEAKEEYVQTIFGLKYLSWAKNGKKEIKPKFRSWNEAVSSSFKSFNK